MMGGGMIWHWDIVQTVQRGKVHDCYCSLIYDVKGHKLLGFNSDMLQSISNLSLNEASIIDV